ncbi:hypothetical protein AABB24_026042, partial [Solanum stoloniferum]
KTPNLILHSLFLSSHSKRRSPSSLRFSARSLPLAGGGHPSFPLFVALGSSDCCSFSLLLLLVNQRGQPRKMMAPGELQPTVAETASSDQRASGSAASSSLPAKTRE